MVWKKKSSIKQQYEKKTREQEIIRRTIFLPNIILLKPPFSCFMPPLYLPVNSATGQVFHLLTHQESTSCSADTC